MPRYDFRTQRLYVKAPLAAGANVALDAGQTNYLCNVLRLSPGDPVLVFNGRDGEWRASLAAAEQTQRRTRSHRASARPDRSRRPALSVRAAEGRAARLHGAESGGARRRRGCSRSSPATPRPRASMSSACRPTRSRRPSNAACSISRRSCEPLALDKALAALDENRLLVFCDEDAPLRDPVAALSARAAKRSAAAGGADRSRGRLRRRGEGDRCCAGRTCCVSRSARASCAPTPRRSPRSRSCRPCWGIGGNYGSALPGRRSTKPVVRNEKTRSPCWLVPVASIVVSPQSGRDCEARASTISAA